MRWWVLLCVAVLWDTASLQPTRDTNGDRECCPCPKDSTGAATMLVSDQSPASTGARATCPCEMRAADSVGAPSMFLPDAVRAIRPFVSLDDSKEEPKPLLHPEVDLASSVLDTLREATNEEYEDALARDAARAVLESDGIAAESAPGMVTVVISPKDSDNDVISEASHVHEARCISPLGRSSLSLRSPAFRSSDLLTDILRLPKRKPPTLRAWKLFDMDSGVGASNINEQVVEPSFKETNTDSAEAPSVVRFSTGNKPKSTLSVKVPTLFKTTGRSGSEPAASILTKLTPKTASANLDRSDISKLIPKIDTSRLFRKSGDDDLSLTTNTIDNNSAPGTMRLQIPHISTIIPKIDLTSPKADAQENGNVAQTLTLGIPSVKFTSKMFSNNIQQKSNDDVSVSASENKLKVKIPNLKVTARDNQIIPDDVCDNDSINSASTLHERYSSFSKSNDNDVNDLQSKTIESYNRLNIPAVKSMNLKNVENTDIDENSPKTNIGLKLKVPNFKHAPSKSRDATTDFINNILKGLQVPNLNNLISSDVSDLRNKDMATKTTEQKEIHVDEPENQFATEILDTVPSSSGPEINRVNIDEKERENDVTAKIDEEMQNMIEELPVKTEIIDTVPNSESSNIDSNEVIEIDNADIEDDSSAAAASEQIQNFLAKEEGDIELINQQINEDNIDVVLDEENNGLLDRKNDGEIFDEESVLVRDSFDDMNKDGFTNENKIDGLTITADMQSLDEKSVPETRQDSLHPIRVRLRQRIESLKQAPKLYIDLPRSKGGDKLISDQSRAESQNQDVRIDEQDLESENSDDTDNQVNTEDLQQMSDSLLNQEKEQADAIERENINTEITDLEPVNDDSRPDNVVLETNNLNSIDKVDTTCIVNEPKRSTESDTPIIFKNNEMAVGASERVSSISGPEPNLASPLRQSIVLEPVSFGSDLNLFNGPGPISNLFNNPLPDFQIPNLLRARARKPKLFAPKDDSLDDAQIDSISMSAQASTPTLRSRLPPHEDMNLDILQLKPLSADMPTLPRLNLNSFKTKLAVPKFLDLKPVLLESSVGSKQGVVEATLSLGSGNELDRSNSLQQASSSRRSSNILRQPIVTLPNLSDLRETLRENAHNLLSTPLETTGKNVVEDTLRSGHVLTDNLRVHAENAVKDIQQSLKGVGLHSHGSLGSFRSSGDLLQDISRRHEDVNDKLKGISVDLSDRLETLRDNILDQYRIPSLGSSLFGQSRTPFGSIPESSSSFRASTKSSQPNLKISSKGKFVTKPKTSPRTSTNKSRLKASPSIATPKAVEFPKLRTTPKESSVLKFPVRESPLKNLEFLSRDRPSLRPLQPEKNLNNFDRPLIKKPRLGQSKFKISFSTTPIPPTLRSKTFTESKLGTKPLSLKEALPSWSAPKESTLGSKLSSLRDSSGLASEVMPTRVKAPVKAEFRTPTDSDDVLNADATTIRPPISLSLKSRSSLGKSSAVDRPSLLKSKLMTKEPILKTDSDDSELPALSWPKKLDDEFLGKVREALRARLAGAGKKSVKPVIETKTASAQPAKYEDMARSASNNIEVASPVAMNENTSYTCNMMCTKNT